MAEAITTRVEYPAADPSAAAVVIEHILPDMVDEDFARGTLRAIRDSYIPQYGGRQVPASALREAYDPDDADLVRKQQKRMLDRMEHDGAQYWVARGSEPGHLRGLSKIFDGYTQTYIGDVMVTPPWGDGLGRRLLHAPLAFGGFGPRKRVALDGFVGSSVNAWYERLGFEPRNISGHLEIGDTGYSMLMREYQMPLHLGLVGLVGALEASDPQLARAIAH